MSACLCFTLYHGRNVQLRAKVWGPKLPWCFFFFAAWAFWLKSRALAYVRVFDQYNALNEFQYAKLRLKIFRFFCRCRGLQTLVRDCMSFASACFHVVQSCTQRTKLCHFLLCSSAAIMALSSSHACLIVRESGTDQVFSCRAWKIVRCTKWDKRNSLHAIPSPEVRHSAKMQDREREREKKKKDRKERKRRAHDVCVTQPSSSGMRERREGISLAEARRGKWSECLCSRWHLPPEIMGSHHLNLCY